LYEREGYRVFEWVKRQRFKSQRSEDEIERKLEDFYAGAGGPLRDVPRDEARKMVRDAIEGCKRKGLEEGTADLGENFGDVLLLQSREGLPAAVRIVENARSARC
jgi:hypothetical protein